MVGLLLMLLALGFLMRGRGWKRAGNDALPAVLASAERAGIITVTQREQILAHAAANAPAGRLGGVGWLGVFAGLFVAAGVSLLIAHNWDSIGAVVRIAAFLAVLLAVGETAIRAREGSFGVSLTFELVWLFLPLLGIGLYAQTFQLSGDPIRPFLVWLALSAPLAWMSRRPVVAAIHTFAMAAVLFTGDFVVGPTTALLGGARSAGMLALTGASTAGAWLLSLVLLGAITLQSLRLLPRAHRHHFVGVWVIWIFCVLVTPTPLRIHHEGWIILAAITLATLWIVILTAMDASIEERAMSALVWLGTLYALTFTWHMDRAAAGDAPTSAIAVVVLAFVAAIGGALALPPARLSPFPAWARAAKMTLVAPAVVTLVYLTADVRLVWLAAILMNVILIAIAVGLMWHGSLVHEIIQINLGVLILVWVLITRFLDVFGGMLRSGIGFIVAGVLLATLAWALERTRRRLIATPGEVAS